MNIIQKYQKLFGKLNVVDMGDYTIYENDRVKLVRSENYNYDFDKKMGVFRRWGKTLEDDPVYCPFGPEIADIEIVAGGQCSGCKQKYCYKRNYEKDKPLRNMGLENFKTIFNKLPKTVNTIAFGITDISKTQDFFEIMQYTRDNGVIPTYTTSGADMTPEYAQKTAKLCGAVAVSVHNKEVAYNAVKMLGEAGQKQINFHVVVFDGVADRVLSIIDDIKTDERLKYINALVLLRYKPKNTTAEIYKQMSKQDYKKIFKYAQDKGVPLGMDSCNAPMYLDIIKDEPDYEYKSMFVDCCESSCFSWYINCEGQAYSCSFCEGECNGCVDWTQGINMYDIQDFVKDVWNNPKTVNFRNVLLKSGRHCPMYNLEVNNEI